MKSIFLILISVFIVLPSKGQDQQQEIDSLKSRIYKNDRSDTSLFDNLFQIAELYFFINLDSSLTYYNKCLFAYKDKKSSPDIIKIYQRLGRVYLIKQNYSESKKYNFLAINESIIINDSSFLPSCYINLMNAYLREEKTDSILIFSKKFNDIDNKFKNPRLIYINKNMLFDIYINSGQYDRAFEQFSILKDFAEKMNLIDQVGMSLYTRIGRMYMNNNDYFEAEKYLLIADTFLTQSSYYEILVTKANLGFTLSQTGRTDKAVKMLNYVIDRCENLKYNDILIYSLNNLTNLYTHLEKYDSALYCLKKVKSYLKYANNESHILYNANGYLLNIVTNRLDDNEFNLIKLENSLKNVENPSIRIDVYNSLSEAFKKKNDFYNALKYYELKNVYQDSFNNEKNKQAFLLLKIDYEIDAKNKEIENLILKSDLQKAEIQKKRITILLSLISLFFVLISSILAIFIINRRKRTAELVYKQNEELAHQEYQSLFKESQLQAIREKVAGQEEERARIARELHDGIGGTLAAIKMQMEQARQTSRVENLSALSVMIGNTYEEVRTISHNLMPPQFSDISIDAVLKNHIRELNKEGKINFTIQFLPQAGWEKMPSNIQVELYRIVQELCTNIIKYSDATKVEIQLSNIDNEINLTIEDNGTYFDYKENGIGYRNLLERLKILGGSFEKGKHNGKGNTQLVQISLQPETNA